MKKSYLFALVLLCMMSSAYAHVDRILKLQPDGSIPDIPSSFGKATLKLKNLGTNHPSVQLQIGKHQTTLSPCLSRYIQSKSTQNIHLSGSWYHKEVYLPYYVQIEFRDHGSKESPDDSSQPSTQFLFNLHNAQLLEATRIPADRPGVSGKIIKLDTSSDCKEP